MGDVFSHSSFGRFSPLTATILILLRYCCCRDYFWGRLKATYTVLAFNLCVGVLEVLSSWLLFCTSAFNGHFIIFFFFALFNFQVKRVENLFRRWFRSQFSQQPTVYRQMTVRENCIVDPGVGNIARLAS